jgi:hypothetical protein
VLIAFLSYFHGKRHLEKKRRLAASRDSITSHLEWTAGQTKYRKVSNLSLSGIGGVVALLLLLLAENE